MSSAALKKYEKTEQLQSAQRVKQLQAQFAWAIPECAATLGARDTSPGEVGVDTAGGIVDGVREGIAEGQLPAIDLTQLARLPKSEWLARCPIGTPPTTVCESSPRPLNGPSVLVDRAGHQYRDPLSGVNEKYPCGDPARRAADQHAQRLCAAYSRKVHAENGDSGSSASTTGAVDQEATERLGHQLPPWNQFPDDHFVAACSYVPHNAVSHASSTICPNGAIAFGDDNDEVNVIVDDGGRTSSDPLNSTLPAATPPTC